MCEQLHSQKCKDFITYPRPLLNNPLSVNEIPCKIGLNELHPLIPVIQYIDKNQMTFWPVCNLRLCYWSYPLARYQTAANPWYVFTCFIGLFAFSTSCYKVPGPDQNWFRFVSIPARIWHYYAFISLLKRQRQTDRLNLTFLVLKTPPSHGMGNLQDWK